MVAILNQPQCVKDNPILHLADDTQVTSDVFVTANIIPAATSTS